MDLTIIIVNWNTAQLLHNCLASLQGLTMTHEIIVWDNASADDSCQMVRQNFPSVRLIPHHHNLGFAQANNRALELAQGESLLLLNPDTIVHPQAIDRLWQQLKDHSRLGIVGPQLLNADQTTQQSWGVFPSWRRELPWLRPHITPQPLKKGVEQVLTVEWVSGACLMIKRETITQIGLLDESFWLYTEETDWCYRAKKAGWQIGFVPSAQVTHLSRAASSQRHRQSMLHFYHSRLLFSHKHEKWWQTVLLRGIWCAKVVAWLAWPSRSPLREAYPTLRSRQIRTAYLTLWRYLLIGRGQEVRPIQ